MADMSAQLRDATVALFTKVYGGSTSGLIIASAPGRVNLIGEHTDYNDGFVLPMAIERETFIVGRRTNSGNTWRLVSLNVGDTHDAGSAGHGADILTFDATSLVAKAASAPWHAYLRGVIAQYIKAGHSIPPFDAAIGGNVPLGGGLSSSASLEVSTATFLDGLLGVNTDGKKKALMCQAAEHEFANVPCGIMDQFISANGAVNHAMLLDCRSQEFKLVPFINPKVAVLIVNSNVKHALGSGEYAKRRAQCEEALKVIQRQHPHITSLRDVTLDILEQTRPNMTPLAYTRAHHAISETERTQQAAQALSANNYTEMGKLMTNSHVSLKNDYEVSCDELDALVDIALSQHGVYGSRMTGGGFGGCTVTLCEADRIGEIQAAILAAYKKRVGKEATPLLTRPAHAARLHSA